MHSGQQRVILAGNGSWDNRGCEAIEISVRDILESRMDAVGYVVLPFANGRRDESLASDVARLTPPSWNVERLSFERVRRSLNSRGALERSHHTAFAQPFRSLDEWLGSGVPLVQIGGDNFTLDYGRPDRFFALNHYAIKRGSPVVLWGASIGPFANDPAYERYAAGQLRRVALILARERLTVEYLRSLGVKENVVLAMDPAFALEPLAPGPEAEGCVEAAPIGINVSPLFGRYTSLGSDRLAEETMRLAEAIVTGADRPVVFLPHVTVKGQDDYAWHLAQLQTLEHRLGDGMVRIAPPDLGAQELKWLAGRCTAVIGSRTHLTIASMSSGVPTISLGYSVKARGINREVFGHEDYVIPAREFTAERTLEVLGPLLGEAAAVRESLSSRLGEFRSSAESGADKFASILGGTAPHAVGGHGS